MIKRIIACADIHIPQYKKIPELKACLVNFLEQAKKDVDEVGADSARIVVAGDIFHCKIDISNESMSLANWFFRELNDLCKTYIIAGNHDFLMNNTDRLDTLSTIFEIGTYNNIMYLDREFGYKSGCYTDDNITFCLYSSFENFVQPNIKQEKELHPDNTFVGLIHAEVKGATTDVGRISETGISQSMFEDCDFVIAGHIHKRQELKYNGVKIVYCTSLMQQGFGESIDKHGYVRWDYNDEDEWYDYTFVNVLNPDYGYIKLVVSDPEDLKNDVEQLLNN